MIPGLVLSHLSPPQLEAEVFDSMLFSLPEDYQAVIGDGSLKKLLCLGAYVLLLGRTCRGWGAREGGAERPRRERRLPNESGAFPRSAKPGHQSDSLQRLVSGPDASLALLGSPLKRARQAAMGRRLDAGSFLVGVELSGRESSPQETEGLFGPLTNG